jgi:flagellar biosynthesis/type III secretory pathway M-ring protein FliF/YscJ
MAAGLLGELPALPLHTAGKYVAAAYVVLFALVLIYVVIMAIRLGRIERELGELLSESEMGEDPEQAGEDEDLDVSRAGSTVA